jgi:hypothetical protein
VLGFHHPSNPHHALTRTLAPLGRFLLDRLSKCLHIALDRHFERGAFWRLRPAFGDLMLGSGLDNTEGRLKPVATA